MFSGFTHAAFNFGYEAGINTSTIDGMQDDTDMDEDFKLLEPMDLITKSVDELRKIIK